jgi:hypothetical protein
MTWTFEVRKMGKYYVVKVDSSYPWGKSRCDYVCRNPSAVRALFERKFNRAVKESVI